MALFSKEKEVQRVIGIDISTAGAQYPVDFSVSWGAGARFVVMKSETGLGTIDAGLTPANVASARANGLLVGFYHYCKPSDNGTSTTSAETEADHFIDNLTTALGGDYGDLYLACDFEDTAAVWASNDEAYDYIEAFNNRVISRTGKRCLLYTAYYVVDDITGSTPGNELIHSTKGAIKNIMPLWLAANDGSADYNFTAFGGYDTVGFSGWQFSSDGNGRGAEFGVSSSDIDLDLVGDDGIGMLSVPHKTYGLTATASDGEVELNWEKSFHEDIVSYNIYKDGTLLDTVTHPVTTYTATDLTNNKEHEWQVAAVDAYDEGEKSDVVILAAYDGSVIAPSGGDGSGTLVFTAASPDGDFFENYDGRTMVVVANGTASEVTITVNSFGLCNFGYDDDEEIALPAWGKIWIGIFDKKRFNNNLGVIELNYSDATSVVVASVKV
jgi:GH25 family lysozyme M1 (1,4-beta-N-acetylmuramidase)